jgi:hypothetical protein
MATSTLPALPSHYKVVLNIQQTYTHEMHAYWASKWAQQGRLTLYIHSLLDTSLSKLNCAYRTVTGAYRVYINSMHYYVCLEKTYTAAGGQGAPVW